MNYLFIATFILALSSLFYTLNKIIHMVKDDLIARQEKEKLEMAERFPFDKVQKQGKSKLIRKWYDEEITKI